MISTRDSRGWDDKSKLVCAAGARAAGANSKEGEGNDGESGQGISTVRHASRSLLEQPHRQSNCSTAVILRMLAVLLPEALVRLPFETGAGCANTP